MSQIVTISCDKCHERTDVSHRTKVKWGRESGCKGSYDLCGSCSEWLAQRLGLIPQRLGLIPESLPFGPPDLAENGRA